MKLLHDTWLMLTRSLREGRRSAVLAFALPAIPGVIVTGLVSELYGALADLPSFPTAHYITWMAPGIVVTTAMTSAGFSATGLVSDAQGGYLDRLRLLPVRPAAILLGRGLFEAIRVLPAAIIVLAMTIVLSDEIVFDASAAVGVIALTSLWAVAWNGFFLVAALRTLNPQTSTALQPLFLPFMFLSTTFVPRSLMPGWIERVSDLNPHTYVVEGARVMMTDSFAWGELGAALAVASAIVFGTQLVAARSFMALVRGE